jgi:signal peptidase II
MAERIKISIHRAGLILGILLSTIGCDQATKAVARDTLFRPLSYLHNTVWLVHAQNPGSFLSLGADLPAAIRFYIFVVFNISILIAVAWFLMRRKETGITIGLALVLAGGAGNLIDRLLFGSVTDFIIVGAGPLTTGIFNIADMAIVGGVATLVFRTAFRKSPAN